MRVSLWFQQASESATSDGGSSIHSLGIAGAGGRAFSPAAPLDTRSMDGNSSRCEQFSPS